MVFLWGTSVGACSNWSDARAGGVEDCFTEPRSVSGRGAIEVVHPARPSSETRRMVFVTVASRREVTYYDRLSARGIKATGVA